MRHIIYPVDFSPRCEAIAPAVAAMARRFGARVSKMYIARPPDGVGGFGELHGHFLTAVEEMRGGLGSYQAAQFEGIETESVFRIGQPAREIVDFAGSPPDSLIMMATHGYSPFRQLLLGSVASGVLHDAQCPVWTCTHAEEFAVQHPEGGYCSILCAVDMGPFTESVIDAAAQVAAQFQAAVHTVHAGQTESVWPAASAQIEMLHGGNVVPTLMAAAERYGADLLVIGRGHAQGMLGRLRSNAHDLIRFSRCPVLSV